MDHCNISTSDTSLVITKSEVKHAIILAKYGKATGPDQVYYEILKMLDESSIIIITDLLIRYIGRRWLLLTSVPILKKPRTSQPDAMITDPKSHKSCFENSFKSMFYHRGV